MPTKKQEKEELVETTPEQKVLEIKGALNKLAKEVAPLNKITSQEQYEQATVMVVQVKGYIKRIGELKTKYVTPFKDHIKVLEGMFNEPLKEYEKMESAVKQAMSAYQMEQREIARKAEEKELAKRKKQEEKTGKPVLKPMPVAVQAPTTVHTTAGKTATKTVWKFDITDYTKLPKEIHQEVLKIAIEKGLYEQVVRKQVTAGLRKMDGVNIYEDVQISITA